ncbi:MAG: hypothetical protein ACI4M5_02105 [Christensenellales bacterium]
MNKLMEREKYEQSTYENDVNNFAYYDSAYGQSGYTQSYYNNAANNGYYQNDYQNDYQNSYYNQAYNAYNTYSRDNNQYNQSYNAGYRYQDSCTQASVDYARPQEYSGYYYRDNSEGYVRQNPAMNQNVNNSNKTNAKKKSKLNIKAKMLICVYFFIVAVIATLLIINMATAGTGAVSASVEDSVTYNEEAMGYAVDADGNVIELQPMEDVVQYDYDTSTGGFDNLCDSIAKVLG